MIAVDLQFFDVLKCTMDAEIDWFTFFRIAAVLLSFENLLSSLNRFNYMLFVDPLFSNW